MIVKVLARHSPTYKQLLNYILQAGKESNSNPLILTHNFRSSDISGYVTELIRNEANRKVARKNVIYLYHEILSLSQKEDMIGRQTMQAIVQKYIELRGLDGMYIGALHEDQEHIHAHILTSGLKYRTGKAHRLSHQDLRNIKIKLQEFHLQFFPELQHSTVNFDRNQSRHRKPDWARQNRMAWTEKIKAVVADCYSMAVSREHFYELLQEHDLLRYERSHKTQGIVTPDGLKIRFNRLDIDIDKLPAVIPELSEEIENLKQIENLRRDSLLNNPLTMFDNEMPTFTNLNIVRPTIRSYEKNDSKIVFDDMDIMSQDYEITEDDSNNIEHDDDYEFDM